MTKVPAHMKQFTTQVPLETYDAMVRLSNKLGRSFSREVEEAFLRHLAAPPALVAPPLTPRTTADARPAGKPGRPARKTAPKPQKGAERRTEARQTLAALDADAGLERVSTRDEWTPPPALEDSVRNADPS